MAELTMDLYVNNTVTLYMCDYVYVHVCACLHVYVHVCMCMRVCVPSLRLILYVFVFFCGMQ